MTSSFFKTLFLSVGVPLFGFSLNAQTYCDDLTTLPEYSLTSITDTIFPGDTISMQNAYNVIELGGTYTNWYYHSNSGVHDGILGDAHFKIKPEYEAENLTVTIYNSSNWFLIPSFVLNGDTSANLNSTSSAIVMYEVSDFPMVVGNVNVSVDTNIVSMTCDNGIIHSGYKLICNGPVEELEIIFSIDLGYITEVCYESSALNVEEAEHVNMLYPNPTSGYLQIQSDQVFNTVRIHNLLGKEVLKMPLSGLNHKINCSHFVPGIYLVTLEGIDGKIYTEKVIINK